MSTAREYHPRYTIKDYNQWEGDWELWHGVAVSMSPSAFGAHASVHARLSAAIVSAIDDAGCNATVLTEIDWIIANDTVVRPDLTVVCGGPPKGHVEEPPAVAVEIVSPSSKERDNIRKRALFEAEGVDWYLIADPESKRVTALRLEDGSYSQVPADAPFTIDICDGCELTGDLTKVFR